MGPFTGTANCVRVSFGSPAGARVAALRPLMEMTLVGFLVIALFRAFSVTQKGLRPWPKWHNLCHLLASHIAPLDGLPSKPRCRFVRRDSVLLRVLLQCAHLCIAHIERLRCLWWWHECSFRYACVDGTYLQRCATVTNEALAIQER